MRPTPHSSDTSSLSANSRHAQRPQRPGWRNRAEAIHSTAVQALVHLQPVALLAARLWVAQAFFLSGLTKLRDWPTTLLLFENEYAVPLLHPHLAAWAGTFGEVVLPVLLVLGLAGRVAAAGLSVVNAVAVLSLAQIAPAALQQHQFWGSVLLALLLWGPGRWSLDALWAGRRRHVPR